MIKMNNYNTIAEENRQYGTWFLNKSKPQ